MCDLLCFCMTLLYLINICTYSLVKLFEVIMACLTLLSLSCILGCNQPLTNLGSCIPSLQHGVFVTSCVGISVIQSWGMSNQLFTINFLFLPYTLLLWKPKMRQPTFIEPLLYSQIYKVSISFHSNLYVQMSVLFPCHRWQQKLRWHTSRSHTFHSRGTPKTKGLSDFDGWRSQRLW